MAEALENINEEELSTFERLTGTQKSAILMMLLGEDEASEIINQNDKCGCYSEHILLVEKK